MVLSFFLVLIVRTRACDTYVYSF